MRSKLTIEGQVSSKRTKRVSRGWGTHYYVTIGEKEFFATIKIYDLLSVGSYVSVSYKKSWILGEYIIFEVL